MKSINTLSIASRALDLHGINMIMGTAIIRRNIAVATQSKSSDSQRDMTRKDILQVTSLNGVTTMRMNTPKKLNGWTMDMMNLLKETFTELAKDSGTKVAVLTGTDPYYSAGANLAGSLKVMHPKKLHEAIRLHNESVFDNFIEFPKPLIVAVNGPAIGATVTTATLSDCILASEKATFLTPFAKLGIPPEGCSSIHFEKIMGKRNAERMLGAEGWKPTGAEAKEAGFVAEVLPHDQLMTRAQELGEEWVESGKKRWLVEQNLVAKYKAVNARESAEIADAFLSYKFLNGQYEFLKAKNKTQMAQAFWFIKSTHPMWSRMI